MTRTAQRTNETMKVLTMMASVFIPLTFIVGVYGMNFHHMPELEWRWSYPILWIVMITLAVSMFVGFRRRGWIGTGASREAIREARAKRDT